jgi:N utilization substance protein B
VGRNSGSGGAVDRRKARVLAMQGLCQLDAQGEDFLLRVPAWLADSGESQTTISYAQQVIERAWADRAVTAGELARHAVHWSAERMASVDRNVIRVALAEFDLKEAPPKVILNEAIEIAGEFGGGDSGRFVNGVLDAVRKGT